MNNGKKLLDQYMLAGFIFIIVCIITAIYWPNMLGDVLLLGTALILLFYTYFTHSLRDEMRKQNELSIRPILVPFLRNDFDGIGWYLSVRNTGNGTAVDVELDIQPKIYHHLFPVSRTGQQDERIFAPNGNEKQIKFIMDDHVPRSNDSYSISLDRPSKISEKHKDAFSYWAESDAWVINFYYYDIDGNRWHTFARKKKNEFVIHDVKISRLNQ